MSEDAPFDTSQLSSKTTLDNSAVRIEGRNVIVELDPDHPGFRDQDYRQRRNEIARLALEYQSGDTIPEAPYSEAEHEVWRIVWEKMAPVHARFACKEYLEMSHRLGLPRDRIPQLAEVSAKLEQVSGFRQEPVAGLVHSTTFQAALANNIFLSTQYIRHHSTPLYTPEPDVIHELVGHSAMLAIPKLAELNRLFGQAAMRCESEEAIERLGHVYWYTIEFGILKEEDEIRAYGAGLLSSYGELGEICREGVEHRPIDFREMEERPYDPTQYQPVLYLAESFDGLYETLKPWLLRWATEEDPFRDLHI